MTRFLDLLRVQRWDDHRFYHHSRINQSLHLLSACTFVLCYGLAFRDLALASLIAWLVAMTSRQSGHLFFEPRDYDHVNQATDEHKEAIKVGYNIERKLWLLAVWALSPLLLLVAPAMFGLLTPATGAMGFTRNVGWLWLAVAAGGLLFRVVQLCVTQGVLTGVVWATKIVTDPFHDIMLYHMAPVRMLSHGLIDDGIGAERPQEAGVHR